MALRSEAKEIMGRIDKLTVDYDGAVSQLIVGSSAEAKGSNAVNGRRSSGSLASSKKGGAGEEKGTIKQHVISSELQFKKFQQDKGRMTMIMLDHVKLGMEQKEVLNGLKNWFYGLDKVDEDDGGEDVTEMESYIMSLSDVLRGTRAAAKKLDDHTLKSTEKLGEVMKSLRRAYNDALNPKFKTIVKGGDDGPAVEVEDPSLQIIALEKNLRDAQFELMAGKEAFERERKELNKRLEKADDEVSAFLEQNNLSSSDHREQIHALKKKCLVLEEEKAALEVKCKRIETVSRDPTIGALFKGGTSSGGALAAEKAELEEQLAEKEALIKNLRQSISDLESKMSFYKGQAADSDFGMDAKIKEAEKRAKREAAKASQEMNDLNQVLKEDVKSLKEQLSELDEGNKAKILSLVSDHERELAKLKEELKSQAEYYKAELKDRAIRMDEMEEQIGKASKAGTSSKKDGNATNKDLEEEVARLKKELEVEKGERKSDLLKLSESTSELEKQRRLSQSLSRDLEQQKEDNEKAIEKERKWFEKEKERSEKTEKEKLKEKEKKEREKLKAGSKEQNQQSGKGDEDNIKKLKAQLAEAISALSDKEEALKKKTEELEGVAGATLPGRAEELEEEAKRFRSESEAVILQHKQSTDRYKLKLEHLASLCVPSNLLEGTEQLDRMESLMSVILESTDTESWKRSETELVEFGQLLAVEKKNASEKGLMDDEKVKNALEAAQGELKESEEARQELTVANAEQKRRIAELENLLKKTKELLAENMEKLGSRMSKDMLNAAKTLTANMKAQMSASRADAEAAEEVSKEKRKMSFAKLGMLTKTVSAFKKGSKDARLQKLKKLSSNVGNSSARNMSERKEEMKTEEESGDNPVADHKVEVKGNVEKRSDPPSEAPLGGKETNAPVHEATVDPEMKEESVTDFERQEDKLMVEEQAVEDQAAEDQAAEDQAIEDQAVEDQAVEDQAVEDQAVEDQAVEKQASDETKDKGVDKEGQDQAGLTPPVPLPDVESAPKPKRGGVGLSIAMKMNMRRRGVSTDSDGSSGKKDSSEEKKEHEEEKHPPLQKKMSHTFEDRLLYFGVKKQKVALSSAVSANLKANSIATKLFKKAKKTSQEKTDKMAEAKVKEEALEQQNKDMKQQENNLIAKKEAEEELAAKINEAAAEERKKLEEERETLRLEHEALAKKMKEEEEARVKLQAELEAEKEEIARLEEMVELEDEQLEEMDEKNLEIESELKQTDKELKVAEKEVEKQKLVEAELKRQLSVAINPEKVTELEGQLDGLKIEQEAAKERQVLLERELAEQAAGAAAQEAVMLERVAELESRLAEEKKRSEEISEAHRRNIIQQAENIDTLQEQLEVIKKEASSVHLSERSGTGATAGEGEKGQGRSSGVNEMIKKLTEEHERTLQEMATTMMEKSRLLELKEADLTEAQDMVHNLRIKVVEGEGEIMTIRKRISFRAEAVEKEKELTKKLMEKREVEKEKLRQKVEKMKAELQEGDEEGRKKLAENEKGYEKILDLMRNHEKLLSDKEEELQISKKSVEELESLVEHYDEAIEKLTQHISEKDSEFEATLAKGEELLKMEKERADTIWKQLDDFKKGKVMDETNLDAALSTHRNTITRMEEKVHESLKSEVEKMAEANVVGASEMEKMEKGLGDERRAFDELEAEAKEVRKRVVKEEHGVKKLKAEVGEKERKDEGAEEDEEEEIVVVKKKKKKKKVVVVEESEEDASVADEEEPEEETFFEIGDLDMDYDEESLRSVVDATSRVTLKLEELESFIDAKPKLRMRDPQLIESRETLELFMEEMIGELVNFGVHSCAALRAEIERTWLKNKMLQQWKSVMGGGKADKSDKSSYRIQYEMPAQIKSLKQAIDLGGGWKAALYLSTGDINLDCEVKDWPQLDQIQMLKRIKEYLEEIKQKQELRIDSTETKLSVERENVAKLEDEVKAARRSAKNKMLNDRKRKGDEGNSLISISDFNKERKLMAKMHERSSHLIMDIMKLSMPSKQGKKKSVLLNVNTPSHLGIGSPGTPGSTGSRPGSTGRPWSRSSMIEAEGGRGGRGLSMRFDDAFAQEEGGEKEGGGEGGKEGGGAESEQYKKLIEQSTNDYQNAKRLSRRMSIQPRGATAAGVGSKGVMKEEGGNEEQGKEDIDEDTELAKMNPREMKEQIETTDVVTRALEHDMAMMDKALSQLKLRKKEEAQRREEENGLKERENAILVDSLDNSYKLIRTFKADYISEDVEDVIAALKQRVSALQDHVTKAEKKYEALLEYQLEGNDDGDHGKLEVLERTMKEKQWVMKLLNNLLVQKMTYTQSLDKINSDLKRAQARRGMVREVKALTELKKKCKDELEKVEIKIAEVKKDDNGYTEMLRELYERIEMKESQKGLGGGDEGGEEGGVGDPVHTPALFKRSTEIVNEFKEKEKGGDVKIDWKEIDGNIEQQRLLIASASGASVGNGAMMGMWVDGDGPERPSTTPMQVLEGGWEKKFTKSSGKKIIKKKKMVLKGVGGVEDAEVMERIEANSLEAKMVKFEGMDKKANYLPLLARNQVSVQRPMTGIEGSQSRQGIASDLLQGQR
ncbi:hypothetical protein TrCOL_g8515 [Triparma columacea]|uniref:Uncharacterized protein n=1 Tax=Triparma columacea TaxID=722753 RepID=A0A9W7FYW2_9STRA|nr:hypothetical protein TrCOL_g8515 [Triparma columacea]